MIKIADYFQYHNRYCVLHFGYVTLGGPYLQKLQKRRTNLKLLTNLIKMESTEKGELINH